MRIHITGNAGSGKTTLARELGEILEIDVFGLDKIVWKESWEITSKEERTFLELELTRKKKWIIEGVSSTARQSADYVIFLDLSRLTCLKRAVLRSLKYLFSTRSELPKNCPEYKIVHKLIKMIWQFNKYARPIIIEDLKNKNCIAISGDSDLYDFIENVRHNKIIDYTPNIRGQSKNSSIGLKAIHEFLL